MRKEKLLDALRLFVQGHELTARELSEKMGVHQTRAGQYIRNLKSTGVIYRSGHQPPPEGLTGRWAAQYKLGPGTDVVWEKRWTIEKHRAGNRRHYKENRDAISDKRKARKADANAGKIVQRLAKRDPFLYPEAAQR